MPLAGPRRTSHYQTDCQSQDTYISRSCHALCEISSKRRTLLVLCSEAQDAKFAKIVPSSKVGAVRAGIFGWMKLYVVIYVVRIIVSQTADFVVNSVSN